MCTNLENVHFWFEFEKNLLPEEVLEYLEYHSTNLNKRSYDPLVYENNNRLYARTPVQIIDEKCYVNLHTAGWQNLPYRIFIEKNALEEIELKNIDPYSLNRVIEGYNLGLITIGEAFFVQGKRYYFKKDNWMAITNSHVLFVCTPNK